MRIGKICYVSEEERRGILKCGEFSFRFSLRDVLYRPVRKGQIVQFTSDKSKAINITLIEDVENCSFRDKIVKK
jgi:hypothetical protein